MVSFSSFVSSALVVLCATATTLSKPVVSRQSDTVCGTAQHVGIVQPANGAVITTSNIPIVYCSGQYFKTSSIDASALLSLPGQFDSGELLVKDIKPDNQDVPAGYYSYRFNATIPEEDGDWPSGQWTLSIYETATGKPLRQIMEERDAYETQGTTIQRTMKFGPSTSQSPSRLERPHL